MGATLGSLDHLFMDEHSSDLPQVINNCHQEAARHRLAPKNMLEQL